MEKKVCQDLAARFPNGRRPSGNRRRRGTPYGSLQAVENTGAPIGLVTIAGQVQQRAIPRDRRPGPARAKGLKGRVLQAPGTGVRRLCFKAYGDGKSLTGQKKNKKGSSRREPISHNRALVGRGRNLRQEVCKGRFGG